MRKPFQLIPAIVIFSVSWQLIAECPQFSAGIQSGTVESGLLIEISGIAASRKNTNVLWTHNDSGGTAKVYAMDVNGRHLGIYSLSGATAVDWEDMAIGPGPEESADYLYLADIGDNSAARSNIVVYRVSEPNVDSNQAPVSETLLAVESITLNYPDGARDAEVLMVDPATRDIYIVSKWDNPSRIYVAYYPQSTSSTIVMEYKGELPWGLTTTGGDVSAAGDLVIIRRYFNASVWRRIAGMELWEAFATEECDVPLIFEIQGEAVCFDAEGCGYYTISEGAYKPIYYFARGEECPLQGDCDGDGNVGVPDLKIIAANWLEDCDGWNFWCDRCDIDKLRGVDLIDFAYLGQDWGK